LVDFTGKKRTAVKGKAIIPVTVGSEDITVTFIVVPGLSENVILGLDLLVHLKSVLDFGRNTATFHLSDFSVVCNLLPVVEQRSKGSSLQNINRISTTPCHDLSSSIQICESSPLSPEIVDVSSEEAESLWDDSEVPCAKVNFRHIRVSHKYNHLDEKNQVFNGRGIVFNEHPDLFASDEEIFDAVAKSQLNNDLSKTLLSILIKHREVFAKFPGLCKDFQYELNVQTKEPIVRSPYPIAHKYRDAVRDEVQKMLSLGIIAESSSCHLNPLHVVPKKAFNSDGTQAVRLVLDLRLPNVKTPLEHVRCEKFEDLMAKFHGKNKYTLIDFCKSYLQIKLSPSSYQYTSFIFEGIQYVYCNLPFGQKNGSSALNACMQKVLGPELLQSTIRYIDDLCLANESAEEHLKTLDSLLHRIKVSGMTLNIEKCSFLTSQVKFLSFIVTPSGYMKDPESVQAIVALPPPVNLKQLRHWLGVLSWHRRHIENFSLIASPLFDLLKSGKKWQWTTVHDEALTQLRNAVVQDVQLSFPDFSKTFVIQTDANMQAIAAALYQTDETGEKRVIEYISRTLSPAERNYTVTEVECLSIVYASKKWETYLLGHSFVVRTDHKALLYLDKMRNWNARLMRWSLQLQRFDFTIEYVPGVLNDCPDALTRLVPSPENIIVRSHALNVLNEDVIKLSREQLAAMQWEDEAFAPILGHFSSRQTAPVENNHIVLDERKRRTWEQFYKVEQGILLIKDFHFPERWRVCVPAKLVPDILRSYHDNSGHFGRDKCLSLISKSFHWPSMNRQIKEYVRDCVVCMRTKPHKIPVQSHMQSIQASSKGELVSCDLYGPLPRGPQGQKYLLTVLDCYSRLFQAYCLRAASSETIIRCLESQYFQHLGVPDCILTDNGPQFTSKKFSDFLARYNVKLRHCTPFHPSSSPVERPHSDISRLFRLFCAEKHRDWPKFVSQIVLLLNHSISSSLGISPIEMHFNVDPSVAIERHWNIPLAAKDPAKESEQWKNKMLLADIRRKERISRRNAKIAQQHSNRPQIKLGDFVFLKQHPTSNALDFKIAKFFHVYKGPYVCETQVGTKVFELRDPSSGQSVGIHSIDNLKLWNPTASTRSQWLRLTPHAREGNDAR
jgi:hypothetical protein